jgi:hypothetical protein
MEGKFLLGKQGDVDKSNVCMSSSLNRTRKFILFWASSGWRVGLDKIIRQTEFCLYFTIDSVTCMTKLNLDSD